jgi:hypothetical protein
MARLMTLGMVKTLKDWIIRNQVLKVIKPMDAVHRLNVDGVSIL